LFGAPPDFTAENNEGAQKKGAITAPLLIQWCDCLWALDTHGDTHAATDAQGGQTLFGVAPLHFEQ